jgi:hypothetical protein
VNVKVIKEFLKHFALNAMCIKIFLMISLICPTCLMFGEHKGHNVCAMEEASK